VTANGYNEADDDAVVPATGVYPATSASALTNTFTETMVKLVPPAAEIDVKVQMTRKNHSTTLTCTNSNVVVSGGPNGSSYTNYSATTATTSPYLAKFPNPPDTNIVSNASPYDTTSYSIVATTASGTYTNAGNPTTVTGVSGTQTVTVNLGTTNSSTETSC